MRLNFLIIVTMEYKEKLDQLSQIRSMSLITRASRHLFLYEMNSDTRDY